MRTRRTSIAGCSRAPSWCSARRARRIHRHSPRARPVGSVLSIVAFGAVLALDPHMAQDVKNHDSPPTVQAKQDARTARLKDREKRRLRRPGIHQAQPALRTGARQPPKFPGISMTEFVDLSDGQRATLRTDRGWSPFILGVDTHESLTRHARLYLEFEDEECCPISPESVVDRLWRLYTLEIDPESVNAALQLPRRIELADHLLRHLESPLGGRADKPDQPHRRRRLSSWWRTAS